MSGFGASRCGTSPYGIGTPIAAPQIGGDPLTNPSTGDSSGSRAIDPKTGDYSIDGNGRAVGMDDIRQLVLLRIKTTLGKSGVQSLGNDLLSIDRITSNIQYRVEHVLRAAVQDIVDLGLIEVVSVSAERVREGVVFSRFRWRNMATGLVETETVPLTR